MKLLCAVSAIDISLNYGCTPAWWQFFKGLHELGHDVIAVPYAGAAFSTPWWRSYQNPCQFESQAFASIKRWFGNSGPGTAEGGIRAAAAKVLIDTRIRPRWESALCAIIEHERNIDAIVNFNIPVNHFTGLPDRIRSRYNIPVFYFDGDVPASLPKYGGFASGFRGYDGADLSEYDGFMCNSIAGADELLAMGAKRAATVQWGVDPEIYEPLPDAHEFDVFFYGYGVEYREEWFENMMITPSAAMDDAVFAIGGKGFPPTPLQIRYVGNVPFNALRQSCARARINLNISRSAHAGVHGSSTLRLFELAAMGCCIVSNPHDSVDTWFTPDEEIVIVHSAEDAIEAYKGLLANAAFRKSLGAAARNRVVQHHTHRHRAAEIISFISAS